MRVKNSIPICFIRRWQFELVLLGAVLLLVGCLPATPEEVDTCLPEELTSPPNIMSPSDGELVDTLRPMFSWDWPAACFPEHFLIEVFDPTSALISSWETVGNRGEAIMHGELQPATTYTWRVTPSTMGSTGLTSASEIFMTGPLCSDVSAADYPAPILLAPPDGTVIREVSMSHTTDGEEFPNIRFVMLWDDPSRCNPLGYQVEVSTSPTFPVGPTFSLATGLGPSGGRTSMDFFFAPGEPELQDCTRYYWHVRARLSEDESGPYSEIWSFDINTNSIMCTTIGVVSPIPPEIPLPGVPPIARALQNTNCRLGPGTAYEIDSTLFEGQSAPIQGRNEGRSWWLIQNPNGAGNCWVWASAVEATGDLSLIPVVQLPPTPKPVKAGKQGCWVYNPNLQKNVCEVPCPPNAQPGGACKP